jgi:hypothetical protein
LQAHLHEKSSFERRFTKIFACSIIAVQTTFGSVASSFGDDSWTDRNRLAADAWRAVDEIYYDRTFGGNDWFKLRQEIVKKNYKRYFVIINRLKKTIIDTNNSGPNGLN